MKTTFRRSNTWLTAEPCSKQPEGTVWRHRQPKQRTSDRKQAGAMAKQWCLLLSETEEAEGEWEPRRRKWWLEITTKAEPREALQNVGWVQVRWPLSAEVYMWKTCQVSALNLSTRLVKGKSMKEVRTVSKILPRFSTLLCLLADFLHAGVQTPHSLPLNRRVTHIGAISEWLLHAKLSSPNSASFFAGKLVPWWS